MTPQCWQSALCPAHPNRSTVHRRAQHCRPQNVTAPTNSAAVRRTDQTQQSCDLRKAWTDVDKSVHANASDNPSDSSCTHSAADRIKARVRPDRCTRRPRDVLTDVSTLDVARTSSRTYGGAMKHAMTELGHAT